MMFIAHMPAGFLIAHQLLKPQREHPYYIKFLLLGMFASIAPDLDMIYFYLIDHRQHPHHSYWTHIPIFWLGIYALLLYPIYRIYHAQGIRVLTLILVCGLSHMCLDSIASGIQWLYPINTHYHGIWRIPSVYDWWVANYLFHWTFLLELIICSSAVIVWLRDQATQTKLKYQLLLWCYRICPAPYLMKALVKKDPPN